MLHIHDIHVNMFCWTLEGANMLAVTNLPFTDCPQGYKSAKW